MSSQTAKGKQEIFYASPTLKSFFTHFPSTALRRTNYSQGISSGNIKENYTQSRAKERKKEGKRDRYKKQFKMMKTKR